MQSRSMSDTILSRSSYPPASGTQRRSGTVRWLRERRSFHRLPLAL